MREWTLCVLLAKAGAEIGALEATGGYEMLAAAVLSRAGIAVVVVNPAQVSAYAHALGKRARIGRIDAVATKPEVWPLRDGESQVLSALVWW